MDEWFHSSFQICKTEQILTSDISIIFVVFPNFRGFMFPMHADADFEEVSLKDICFAFEKSTKYRTWGHQMEFKSIMRTDQSVSD